MTIKTDELLRAHQLRVTPVRRQVLEVFLDRDQALAHSDLEAAIAQVDRITLYRTLRTFEQKGLIHRAIDGSDKLKYALCQSGCSEHRHIDRHAHFHCDRCGRTLCVDEVIAPSISAPKGFKVNALHLVMQGVCERCGEEE
jgi:Fur family ferric uptake transcriptional regulator